MENTTDNQPLQSPPPPPLEPTVEEQTPEMTEPPVARKRSILKIILICFGILVLVIVAGVGFLLYYLQSKGLTMDRIAPKAVPTSTMTSSTSTSNNYKNNAYNFSLSYPKELKIDEKPYGFGVTSVEMRAADTPKDYGPDVQMLIFPKAIGEQIGQNFDKYYALADNTTQEIKDPTGTTVKFTKIRNRTVNSLRAFDFTSGAVPVEPDIDAEIGVYIEIGADTMVISTPESNKAKLEEMLADFKYPVK